MNFTELQKEMTKASQYMMMNWKHQNDRDDKDTLFIYNVDSFDEIVRLATEKNVNVTYAVKRWFNFQSAMFAEAMFHKYGAIKETNSKHKTIDFYINDIGFDLKNTTLSESFAKRGYYEYDYEEYVKWLYANQSAGGRYHEANRLFIVFACKDDLSKSILLKSRFDLIEKRIKEYMENPIYNEYNINGSIIKSYILEIEV